MSQCIKCLAIDEQTGRREFNIDVKGRVWPCCIFANVVGDPKYNEDHVLLIKDKQLSELFKQDPNWNNLNYHSIKEITSHDIFWNYIWHPGWGSDNPSPICLSSCNNET